MDEIEVPTTLPNPEDMRLALSPDQSVRSTALILALKYYSDTVVKDGVMYQTMIQAGKNLAPMHHHAVLAIAEDFTAFLCKRIALDMIEDAAKTLLEDDEAMQEILGEVAPPEATP